MQDLDLNTIFSAVGVDKVASIAAVPLSELVRAKIAQEHSVETPSLTLPDVVVALAKTAYVQRKTYAIIDRGLAQLAALSPTHKTASHNDAQAPYPIPGSFLRKVALAYKLDKFAALADGDTRDLLDEYRREVTNRAYAQLYKEAGVLSALKGSATAERLGEVLKSDTAKNVGKGLAVGTGLAVPGVAAGSYLSDKATDDARDKALQVAAGTAALGLGAYGIGKGIDRFAERTASGDSILDELTTTFYADALLASQEPNAKIASLRQINRDYGMTLLYRAVI